MSALPQVDRRPQIQSFGLAVRDQGARGTRSVFALAFLLEYQYGSRPNSGYFVFRNRWGSTWGDNGNGYMPFHYVLDYANDLVAYKTQTISATHIGTQAVAPHSDRLDVFVSDPGGQVHGAYIAPFAICAKLNLWMRN